MKRLFNYIIGLSLIFSLSACGDNNLSDAENQATATPQATAEPITKTDADENIQTNEMSVEYTEGAYIGKLKRIREIKPLRFILGEQCLTRMYGLTEGFSQKDLVTAIPLM